MAEFTLNGFAGNLKDLFVNNPNMPKSTLFYINKYGKMQLYSSKHPNREPLHLQEAIENSFKDTTIYQENTITFDLGNENMEKMHPYYHILENTPYIRVANKGSEKTKGSQASVPISKRDYEIISWNGKTFAKEYSRNVRGSRNRDEKVTRRYGNVLVVRDSDSYKNDHYQYIEKIIDSINPVLASMYGMKLARIQKTGLEDELSVQWGLDATTIVDIFKSFD